MTVFEVAAAQFISRNPWLPASGTELREYLAAFGLELMQRTARGSVLARRISAAEQADDTGVRV